MLTLQPGRSYVFAGEVTHDDLRANNVEIIDFLPVDLSELGVKELRDLVAQAQERPLGENRLIWLKNADELSEIVQNTLLKLTEEPPAQLIIVLQTNSVSNLLPTLRSRLHPVPAPLLESLVSSAFPANLSDLDKLLRGQKDRQSLQQIFLNELLVGRERLLSDPSHEAASLIKLLTLTIRRLKQNCNQKLVIDAFLLRYAEISGIAKI